MSQPKVMHDAFERAGMVPHKREYSEWRVTVSAEPQTADSGQALEDRGHNHMRVDTLRNETSYNRVNVCAACGSHNTRCLRDEGEGGREPWNVIELSCDECAAFTQWKWSGW